MTSETTNGLFDDENFKSSDGVFYYKFTDGIYGFYHIVLTGNYGESILRIKRGNNIYENIVNYLKDQDIKEHNISKIEPASSKQVDWWLRVNKHLLPAKRVILSLTPEEELSQHLNKDDETKQDLLEQIQKVFSFCNQLDENKNYKQADILEKNIIQAARKRKKKKRIYKKRKRSKPDATSLENARSDSKGTTGYIGYIGDMGSDNGSGDGGDGGGGE